MILRSISLATAFLGIVGAFQTGKYKSNPFVTSSSLRFFPTSLYSTSISIERTAPREIGLFQEWAVQCGVQPENGFGLVEGRVDGNEDWRAATSSGAAQGSRVLWVPGEMILSADRIALEFQGYADASLEVLAKKGMQDLSPLFHLYLKVLMEYDQGTQSPYYHWMDSLPRKWNTAVAMDDFCVSCLPPYLKKRCEHKREQVAAFREATRAFDYLDPWTKTNADVAKFVYNVVLTRSFESEDGDLRLVPVADMLNHGFPANSVLTYDESGNCNVIVTRDVQPGEDLLLDYGDFTNPAKLLAKYGFLFEDAPATYCKIVFEKPSKELLDIGYDPSTLLIGTANGEIAPAVWDVMLYSRLERKRDAAKDKRAFYEAHMSGDEQTKAAIHQKYFKETCNALRLHTDNVLAEVSELTVRTNAFDSSKHPRLSVIRRHNEAVTATFRKVRKTIEQVSGAVVA